MPRSYDNFNSSCMQKCYQILIPKLVSISHKPPNTIGHRRLSIMYFCVLSETRNSRSHVVISHLKGHTCFTINTNAKLYRSQATSSAPHFTVFIATSSLFTRVQLLLIIYHDNKLFSFTELEASLLQTACSYC